MTSRREFLQIGLAGVAVLPMSTPPWWLADPDLGHALYKVIFDERFPASVDLARRLAGRDASLHGIKGDVTALWYHDLYFRWKKDLAPIAGVTTRESLFCLETIARDAGLVVTRRQPLDHDLVLWSIGPRGTAG